MQQLQELIERFRKERGWDQTDTPSILVKSIFVEASELLECDQFAEETTDLEALKSELADVLMYSLSLCYDLKLDPYAIIAEKLVDVAKRYPKVQL